VVLLPIDQWKPALALIPGRVGFWGRVPPFRCELEVLSLVDRLAQFSSTSTLTTIGITNSPQPEIAIVAVAVPLFEYYTSASFRIAQLICPHPSTVSLPRKHNGPSSDCRLPSKPCWFRQYHLANRAEAPEARIPVQCHLCW
jgi:hypothetical protein